MNKYEMGLLKYLCLYYFKKYLFFNMKPLRNLKENWPEILPRIKIKSKK